MIQTKTLSVLLVISVFLLSSCEVYQTLYGPTGNVPADTGEETPVLEPQDEEPQPSEETMDPEMQMPEEEPIENSEEGVEETVVSGDAALVVVDETEKVSLVPRAEDPDSDSTLVFTFTSPLDENGQWQTTYGDAGEYTVTITASDGELTTTKDVLVIVNKKEEAPTIDMATPGDDSVTISEMDSVDFSVEASDLNSDQLDYVWKLDGDVVGSSNSFTFDSTYDQSGSHTVKIDITDGTSSASKIWSVDVKNVNRKPNMVELLDMTVKENEDVVINIDASDDDNDNLEYSISSDKFEQDGSSFKWKTDYSSAGTYDITVKASDGEDETEQTITVVVENVNRPPVITDILQKK